MDQMTYGFSDLCIIPGARVYGSGEVTVHCAADGRWIDTTDGYWDPDSEGDGKLVPMTAEDLRMVRFALRLHREHEVCAVILNHLEEVREARRERCGYATAE